jgi:hypothetical protein
MKRYLLALFLFAFLSGTVFAEDPDHEKERTRERFDGYAEFEWPTIFTGLSYINHIYNTTVPSVNNETWDFHGVSSRMIQNYGDTFSLYSRSDVALSFLVNVTDSGGTSQVDLKRYGLTVMLELMLGFGVKVIDTDAFDLQLALGTVGVLDALIATDPDRFTSYVASIGPGFDLNTIIPIDQYTGFYLSGSFSYQLLAFVSEFSETQTNLFNYSFTWGAGFGLVINLDAIIEDGKMDDVY